MSFLMAEKRNTAIYLVGFSGHCRDHCLWISMQASFWSLPFFGQLHDQQHTQSLAHSLAYYSDYLSSQNQVCRPACTICFSETALQCSFSQVHTVHMYHTSSYRIVAYVTIIHSKSKSVVLKLVTLLNLLDSSRRFSTRSKVYMFLIVLLVKMAIIKPWILAWNRNIQEPQTLPAEGIHKEKSTLLFG